jgi:hypothetical protein
MDVVNARCAGLDVHKRQVVVCVRTPDQARGVVRTFGIATPQLLDLLMWLTEQRVENVAMEWTGVCWRPHSMLQAYWHILHSGTEHRDLGPHYFEHLDRDRLRRHHIKRLTALGFNVTIDEAA